LFGDCDEFVRVERVLNEADSGKAPFDAEADNEEVPFDVEAVVQRWRRERAWALEQLGLSPDHS
jgi:hypothetical protein